MLSRPHSHIFCRLHVQWGRPHFGRFHERQGGNMLWATWATSLTKLKANSTQLAAKATSGFLPGRHPPPRFNRWPATSLPFPIFPNLRLICRNRSPNCFTSGDSTPSSDRFASPTFAIMTLANRGGGTRIALALFATVPLCAVDTAVLRVVPRSSPTTAPFAPNPNALRSPNPKANPSTPLPIFPPKNPSPKNLPPGTLSSASF